MTRQIAIKVPDEVLSTVDGLVADGTYPNRSAAVRAGLTIIIDQSRSGQIDQAFEVGFRRTPETPDELEEARRLAIEAIEAEPWEPWW